jgi:hypothetical protein
MVACRRLSSTGRTIQRGNGLLSQARSRGARRPTRSGHSATRPLPGVCERRFFVLRRTGKALCLHRPRWMRCGRGPASSIGGRPLRHRRRRLFYASTRRDRRRQLPKDASLCLLKRHKGVSLLPGTPRNAISASRLLCGERRSRPWCKRSTTLLWYSSGSYRTRSTRKTKAPRLGEAFRMDFHDRTTLRPASLRKATQWQSANRDQMVLAAF